MTFTFTLAWLTNLLGAGATSATGAGTSGGGPAAAEFEAAGFEPDPNDPAALRQLLTDVLYRDAARRFARQHSDFDGTAAARRAAELIAGLAAGKTSN